MKRINEADLDYIEHLCNKDGRSGLMLTWRNIRKLVEEKFTSSNNNIPCQCNGETRTAVCNACGRVFHWQPNV